MNTVSSPSTSNKQHTLESEPYPQFQDDRTLEERQTHGVLIGGTDSFLSGWGRAEGKMSYAFWACRPEDQNRVERWVRNRGDIKRVRFVSSDYRPRGTALVHVYMVNENHPALK